jgi:DNA-binding CsgD family transcriptional regulator
VDEVYGVTDLMDYKAFEASRFFQEWCEPNRVLDSPSGCLMKSPTRFAMATCMVSRVASERDRQLGRILSPHIRRAVTIGDLLNSQAIEINNLEAALSALTIGVILTDDQANILYANAAAEAMLFAGHPIRSTGGVLGTQSGAATSILWKAINQAVTEEANLGTLGIDVPLSNSEHTGNIMAHVLPLERRANVALPGKRQAAIFIAGDAWQSYVALDILATIYRLTDTEAQVLKRVGDGETCDEIARSMDVAISTVRTHVNRLLAKTGARRQAQLVQLVSKFSLPISRAQNAERKFPPLNKYAIGQFLSS